MESILEQQGYIITFKNINDFLRFEAKIASDNLQDLLEYCKEGIELVFKSNSYTQEDLIRIFSSEKIHRITTGIKFNCVNIETIPSEIKYFINLNKLDVFYGHIDSFPPELIKCSKLSSIRVIGNNVKNIEEIIVHMSQLKHLELEQLSIKTINFKSNYIYNLRSLNLSSNRLRELPHQIFDMEGLTSLCIEDNPIVRFPDEIMTKLPNLTELQLPDSITYIPCELDNIIDKFSNLHFGDFVEYIGIKACEKFKPIYRDGDNMNVVIYNPSNVETLNANLSKEFRRKKDILNYELQITISVKFDNIQMLETLTCDKLSIQSFNMEPIRRKIIFSFKDHLEHDQLPRVLRLLGQIGCTNLKLENVEFTRDSF
jgi:Leucine-rich repeat (LRR) protein